MNDFVTLSLDTYNELYDKAKKFDLMFEAWREANEEESGDVEEDDVVKFKIGDRVELKYIDNDDIIEGFEIGMTGTIIEYSNVPVVEWDNGKKYAVTQVQIKLIEGEEN